MEDTDILNKFDNDKLIDIVRNYKRYGANELRDYAIHFIPFIPAKAIRKKANNCTHRKPMCHFHPPEVPLRPPQSGTLTR